MRIGCDCRSLGKFLEVSGTHARSLGFSPKRGWARKLDAATQVGANYEQYRSLLIEALAEVNEALRVLPEGQLRTEIHAAMDGYADAGRAWDLKTRREDLYKDEEPGQTLIAKYPLETHSPASVYKPGRRGRDWLKLKRAGTAFFVEILEDHPLDL